MNIYDSILITGGGGMVGHALHDVLTTRNLQPVSLRRAQLDITNPAAVAEVFSKHKPTLVFNCAAHTKVDLCEQEQAKADAINGAAVGTLAALCKESGAALVHLSTDFIFDGSSTQPYKTTDAPRPLSAYGQSKLLGETELQRNAPDRWMIVRTAWVYGRHGANFPRTMVQAARGGKPLKVVNDQFGSPTYALDLAHGIVSLLDNGASGIWHLTNSGQTNWHEFAAATLAAFGINAEIGALTSDQWAQLRPSTAIRPRFSVLDITPYARQVGRRMRPWQQALTDFAQAVQTDGF